ncbi:MAG: hypothetical protein RJR37_14285 [Peptococcaceae bacterium MAG4]|nr:hypothetical protein [Peptococcaceae bacterium MAG4]
MRKAHIFWEKSGKEADKLYDLEKGLKRYISWEMDQPGFRVLKKYSREAEFVLDRFHYMRYVRRAVGEGP